MDTTEINGGHLELGHIWRKDTKVKILVEVSRLEQFFENVFQILPL